MSTDASFPAAKLSGLYFGGVASLSCGSGVVAKIVTIEVERHEKLGNV